MRALEPGPDVDATTWRLLVDSVRRLAGTLAPGEGGVPDGDLPSDLATAALLHGVAGPVRDHLVAAGRAVPAALEHERLAAPGRHLRAVDDLAAVARALDGALPWLVVKGPVVAASWFGRPQLRSYDDVDLLVPGTRLGDALERLESAGAVVVDDDWEHYLRHGLPGELRLRMPSGGLLDVHWRPFYTERLTSRHPVTAPELLVRAVRADVGGLSVPRLSPADALVHLCLHAALSGAARLSWLVDAERAVATAPPSPAELRAAARRWRAGAAVVVQLGAAAQVLRAPHCARLARALPGPTRSAVAVLHAVAPPARGPAPVWRATLLRAVGDGVADTARWGTGAALRRWRWTQPPSPRTHVGADGGQRQAVLQAVGRQCAAASSRSSSAAASGSS